MNTRRRIKATVISNKMTKTVIVEISRSFRHPLYRKVVHSTKHMVVHDELGCNVGDEVQIIESKPISKTKRWVVEKILTRHEVEETVPVVEEG
jgi:small subunit ribosomal protein S17